MAFINKKDFSIVGFVNDYLLKDDYFECDDLIAPAISLLNRKGYKTTFCCSGHPYATIDNACVIEKPTNEELGNDFDLIRIESSEVADYEVDIDEYPYYVVCKCNIPEVLYVSFEKEYKFPKLPGNAYIHPDNNKGIYWGLDETPTNNFDIMEKIYEMNKTFYKWVEKLDYIKEN